MALSREREVSTLKLVTDWLASFSDGDPSLDIIPVNYSIGLKDANPLLFKWRKPYISFQTGTC